MKKLLNTLFVQTQGAYLSKDGENLVVKVEGEERARFPIHLFDGVVCFGAISMSPFLMGLCAERGVAVSFLTENGKFLASVHGPVKGNVLLRREQFRRSTCETESLALARPIVAAKLANCRHVIMRAMRDHGDAMSETEKSAIRSAEQRLLRLAPSALAAKDLARVRGIEGEGASVYFEVFNSMITAQSDDFEFRGRSRRPPLDPLNALLSFLYTLLAHDVGAALEANGLDPCAGFLHRYRPGRRSLALDIMEEFRPHLADRLALSLINRRQVTTRGFKTTETGAVMMSDDMRKAVLVAWQERKREAVRHPYLDETVEIGLLPHCQAILMARHLRGDIDGYPAYLWK